MSLRLQRPKEGREDTKRCCTRGPKGLLGVGQGRKLTCPRSGAAASGCLSLRAASRGWRRGILTMGSVSLRPRPELPPHCEDPARRWPSARGPLPGTGTPAPPSGTPSLQSGRKSTICCVSPQSTVFCCSCQNGQGQRWSHLQTGLLEVIPGLASDFSGSLGQGIIKNTGPASKPQTSCPTLPLPSSGKCCLPFRQPCGPGALGKLAGPGPTASHGLTVLGFALVEEKEEDEEEDHEKHGGPWDGNQKVLVSLLEGVVGRQGYREDIERRMRRKAVPHHVLGLCVPSDPVHSSPSTGLWSPLPSQGRGSEPLICLLHAVMATKEHLETRPHVHPHRVHT